MNILSYFDVKLIEEMVGFFIRKTQTSIDRKNLCKSFHITCTKLSV